jgi:hypothetical protein
MRLKSMTMRKYLVAVCLTTTMLVGVVAVQAAGATGQSVRRSEVVKRSAPAFLANALAHHGHYVAPNKLSRHQRAVLRRVAASFRAFQSAKKARAADSWFDVGWSCGSYYWYPCLHWYHNATYDYYTPNAWWCDSANCYYAYAYFYAWFSGNTLNYTRFYFA